MGVYTPSFVLQFFSRIELAALVISSLHVREQKRFFQYLIVFCCRRSRGHDDDNNNRRLLHNNAELLGWISISSGLIANVPFILYVRVKKLSVKRLGGGDSLTRNLALEHRPIINFHTALNLLGFFTGIFHGILLVRGIDFISISWVKLKMSSSTT